MATSLTPKALPITEDNKQTQAQSEAALNQRRQASRGLEINTDVSKTNAFFHTSNDSTPRPPPSISRKISIKQQHPPTTPTSPSIPYKPHYQGEQDDLYHHDSYANRLRNLVRQQAPSPIPQPLHEDGLVALPTPHLASQPLPQGHRHFVFPDKPSMESSLAVGTMLGAYRLERLLGVGAFSQVYLATQDGEQQLFAIKTIQKGKLLDDPRVRSSIEREIGILKLIDHPNIVHLEATIETESMMCIVLEYVAGGELFEYVQKMHQNTIHTPVDETQVKKLFLQLLQAVKWLHEHHIVHRDLKLENILIHKQNDDEIIKITDFGLARVVDPESPLLVTRCGSEEYAAPEIIQQQSYDGRKTDTWALGIILYSLLVGYLPFRYDPRKQERVSQLFYRIVRAEVKWPTHCQVSQEAKQVVHAILERNPDKRILIHHIQDLPWFQ